MVRTHPQWLKARELVASGRIGELRLVSAHFSYFRDDPSDIRNQVEIGGGGLMDIGCYPVMLARWLFASEPQEVLALMERDPRLGIDRLTSGMLHFAAGRATFNVSTQLVPFQRLEVFGTRGRIELQVPYNAPPDRVLRVLVDDAAVRGAARRLVEVERWISIRCKATSSRRSRPGRVPVPLEDAIANMAVIDALFRSAETRRWENPADF
jgi:predicted dehydrogenase